MEKDLTVQEAWLKETCRELFNQALMAEQMLGCACESCVRTKAQKEIEFKTRFALQIITGCDEEDAIETVGEILKESKVNQADKNTEDARKFLENKFKFEDKSNES